jgi:hypothetical protein
VEPRIAPRRSGCCPQFNKGHSPAAYVARATSGRGSWAARRGPTRGRLGPLLPPGQQTEGADLGAGAEDSLWRSAGRVCCTVGSAGRGWAVDGALSVRVEASGARQPA